MEKEKKVSIKEQQDIFKLIGNSLKEKTECYAVGGTAMMFLGLKEVTKDIDLLFKKKEDYEQMKDVLLDLGAKETETIIINREKVSAVLSLGNARFDLFLEHLIHFELTDSIIARVKEVHEFNNLIIKILSPDDVILFKSMADRQSDKIDVNEIIKRTNVDWKAILTEAELQTKNSEFFFSAFLYSFLISVREDFKIEIPKEFMKELEKKNEEALLKAYKRLKKRKL